MSNAVVFKAEWRSKAIIDDRSATTFAYQGLDDPDQVVIYAGQAQLIIKLDDLTSIVKLVYPGAILLTQKDLDEAPPYQPPIILSDVGSRLVDSEPENRYVPPPKQVPALRAKRVHKVPFHIDRSHEMAGESWTTGDEQVMLANIKTLGALFHEKGGKELLYETTAKQLGRSRKSVRARYYRFKKEGRA